MPSIAGHSLLVVGGSSGMGYGVAQLALEQGLRVAIASSNPTRVKDAVERLQKATNSDDAKVVGYTVDLSGPDVEAQLEKLLTEVKNGFDKKSLNHIVFTAGNSIEHRKTKDIDLDFIQRCGMVRFVAPLLIGKLAPRFVENHWSSSITLTGGKVANKPMPEYTVLTAYAAGAEGMTRNLALDLKPIRVNLVSPGAVLTELWGPNPDGIIAALSQKMPLGKVGSVEEAAEPYIYLMKDTNSTGSIVPTNGGELLL
ncbi:hypothetical protein V1506DRAFT_387201 [Lipomyces tetrasporus]